MSKSDGLKAEIAFLEKLFIVAITALFTLTGWLATTYDSVSTVVQYLAAAAAVFVGMFSIWSYTAIKHKIALLTEVKDD